MSKKCIENNLNMSQIGPRSFELATDYDCHRTSNFLTDMYE